MTQIAGVLIDLGGVVYQAKAVLPGSIEGIEILREHGFSLRFLTNTTSQPLSGVLSKLRGLGVEANTHEIFTPAIAARAYIAANDLNPHFLVQSGLCEDFQGIEPGSNPAVVVGDARDGFNFSNLNAAFRMLEAGGELVALASNRKFVDDDGELSLDVGAFVAALEYASGKTATVLGKPSADFFHIAVADMGLSPGEVVMIGDDAEFDVAAAIRAGLSGYLVKTGKWRAGGSGVEGPAPTAVFDDLLTAARSLVARGRKMDR